MCGGGGRIREELRLAKRFKHSRIFVEEQVFGSVDLLRESLVKMIENPLAKLPAFAYILSVVVDEGDVGDQKESTSRSEDDIQHDELSSHQDLQKHEKVIRTDAELKLAYESTQRSRHHIAPRSSPLTLLRDLSSNFCTLPL